MPYGLETEVGEDQVRAALNNSERPLTSNDNPASSIIQRCWQYAVPSSLNIVDDYGIPFVS